MIEWIYGDSGMGKTTLARKLAAQTANTVLLDGDDMRKVWPELTFTPEDRATQNLRVARLARVLELQGFNVIVATICPCEAVRKEVREITNCRFIHIESTQDKKTWK
jgi:adenylylsulfate kinase